MLLLAATCADSSACPACCCCVLQVRQAYQHKGWVLNNLSGIEQCKDDGYLKALKEQEGEGCHIWGQLTVSVAAAVGARTSMVPCVTTRGCQRGSLRTAVSAGGALQVQLCSKAQHPVCAVCLLAQISLSMNRSSGCDLCMVQSGLLMTG
jgi:hypothetical protein